jgi:hypothetical protein
MWPNPCAEQSLQSAQTGGANYFDPPTLARCDTLMTPHSQTLVTLSQLRSEPRAVIIGVSLKALPLSMAKRLSRTFFSSRLHELNSVRLGYSGARIIHSASRCQQQRVDTIFHIALRGP